MKIVKLMGGLGNQMFQYAFGAALGDDVYYDKSWFDESRGVAGITPREYELGAFRARVKFATMRRNMPKFIRKIFGISSMRKLPVVNETRPHVYCPDLVCDTGYFVGYFQTEKYFAHIRNKILRDFTLRVPLNAVNREMLNKIRKCENPVSLHVRRGDYLQLQNSVGLISLDYYKRAIEYIAGCVKNPHFFLFSDDIEWVRENLPIEHPFTVVDINDANCGWFDLELMKNCKHNIIANSSFSWWGAWLNENPDKIVVAPKVYCLDRQSPDVIPQQWVRF